MCTRPPVWQYEPSAWESEWARAAHTLHDGSHRWNHGCRLMRRNASAIRAWLEVARVRRSRQAEGDGGVLSSHVLRDACTKRIATAVPIEPLVGFLRHPEAHCLTPAGQSPWPRLLSKDHLLAPWHAELWPRPANAFLFDLGASLYDRGAGGASTRWLVDEYAARGIVFDRVYAWEATPYRDASIYERMPVAIVDRISFYNLPVDPRPNASHNPWRTLRAVTAARDFVLVKMDIDNSPIEEALIAQLLADRALASLVDELYFEHHVRNSPMWRYGWHVDTETNRTLADSYDVFRRLRESGIRAHSWV